MLVDGLLGVLDLRCSHCSLDRLSLGGTGLLLASKWLIEFDNESVCIDFKFSLPFEFSTFLTLVLLFYRFWVKLIRWFIVIFPRWMRYACILDEEISPFLDP